MKNGRPHSKKKLTIPIAIIAGMAPAAYRLNAHRSSFQDFSNEFSRIMLGYDIPSGDRNLWLTRFGLQPMVVGFVVHKLANMLGVNRAIANAGIPLIRL